MSYKTKMFIFMAITLVLAIAAVLMFHTNYFVSLGLGAFTCIPAYISSIYSRLDDEENY